MTERIRALFAAADQAGVRLALGETPAESVRGDAILFDAVQVPVVALAVLACINARRGGEPVEVLGARVGHALMSAFPAFQKLGRLLQWSIRVRTVTVDALTFLETSNLIAIAAQGDRKASLTETGRKFVSRVRAAADESTELYQALFMAVDRTRHEELRLL